MRDHGDYWRLRKAPTLTQPVLANRMSTDCAEKRRRLTAQRWATSPPHLVHGSLMGNEKRPPGRHYCASPHSKLDEYGDQRVFLNRAFGFNPWAEAAIGRLIRMDSVARINPTMEFLMTSHGEAK
jgi:hypothetical protein